MHTLAHTMKAEEYIFKHSLSYLSKLICVNYTAVDIYFQDGESDVHFSFSVLSFALQKSIFLAYLISNC